MSPTVRWNVLALLVVAALVVAIWPRDAAPETTATAPVGSVAPAQADPDLADARAAAVLQPCPAPDPETGSAAGSGPLQGLVLDCLGAPGSFDVGAALAGAPVLVNLWAYNCAPCREELPALAAYAEQPGAIGVLTVHAERRPAAGLALLADLGVDLPAVADPTNQVAGRLGAPAVLPTTVLLDADGAVVQVLPKIYTSDAEIAADVETYLGVGS